MNVNQFRFARKSFKKPNALRNNEKVNEMNTKHPVSLNDIFRCVSRWFLTKLFALLELLTPAGRAGKSAMQTDYCPVKRRLFAANFSNKTREL